MTSGNAVDRCTLARLKPETTFGPLSDLAAEFPQAVHEELLRG
jgi:hypothetical protein